MKYVPYLLLAFFIASCGGGGGGNGFNPPEPAADLRINPMSEEAFTFEPDVGDRSDKVVGSFKFTVSDPLKEVFIRNLGAENMTFLERSFGSNQAFVPEIEATLSSDISVTPIDVVYLIDTSFSVVQASADVELITQANALANSINQQNDTGASETVRYRTFDDDVSPLNTSTSTTPFENVGFEQQAGGGTALYEAMQTSLLDLSESPQPLLFVFTDGRENASSAGFDVPLILQTAEQFNIRIFIVGLGAVDASELNDIANASGGKFLQAQTVDDLSTVFTEILGSIPVTYEVVYRPTQRTGHIEFQFVVEYDGASDSVTDDFDVDQILGN